MAPPGWGPPQVDEEDSLGLWAGQCMHVPGWCAAHLQHSPTWRCPGLQVELYMVCVCVCVCVCVSLLKI